MPQLWNAELCDVDIYKVLYFKSYPLVSLLESVRQIFEYLCPLHIFTMVLYFLCCTVQKFYESIPNEPQSTSSSAAGQITCAVINT